MTTLFYTHPDCLDHDMGDHHPEQPDRLRAILRALETEPFALLDRRAAPEGTIEQIERVHAPRYVADIFESVPASGIFDLDMDTALSPMTGAAALRAVGAACDAVDQVMTGAARNAFCGVRPPGHHAERNRAMGFCFFNNAAIAAEHARAEHGAKRVAIVDFDVHHGNGSQSHCAGERDLFYASSHQSPAYPGTGAASETGSFSNIVNVELAPGSGSAEFRAAYEERIFPRLRAFAPELLVISAGFDGHARDPLAYLRLATEDYAWVTDGLLAIANECCAGRAVSVLEGGYDLPALAASTAVHVRALMAG